MVQCARKFVFLWRPIQNVLEGSRRVMPRSSVRAYVTVGEPARAERGFFAERGPTDRKGAPVMSSAY
jgi:hypothetical protein